VAVALGVSSSAVWASDLDTISQRVTADLLSSLPSTSSVQGYMSTIRADGSWADVDYANTAQTNWLPLTHASASSRCRATAASRMR